MTESTVTSHTEGGDHTEDHGEEGEDGEQLGGGAHSCDHHGVRGAGHKLLGLLAYKWQNN